MRRCIWCDTVLEDRQRGGLHEPHWVCPTCAAEFIFGPSKAPDPDRLRQKGDELHELADQLGSDTPLARRIRRIGQ